MRGPCRRAVAWGALLLERRHLLPQGQVFNHEGGPAPHRPDRTGAERDEEDENTEPGGGVCPFPVISSGDPLSGRDENGT